jgi:hypothetical protein
MQTPLESCGMTRPPVDPSPHGDPIKQRERNRRVRGGRNHLTVCEKNIRTAGTSQGAFESSRQPVIPPAPLTGDAGRGCGDAIRALLFWLDLAGIS